MSMIEPLDVHRIAVGLDGSAESAAAAHVACRLAVGFRASLVGIHAVGLLEHAAHASPGPLADAPWAAPLTGIDLPYELVAADGPPPETLAAAAARAGADLIVVGTRGAGSTVGVIGSTAAKLVGVATVPVLVVPT